MPKENPNPDLAHRITIFKMNWNYPSCMKTLPINTRATIAVKEDMESGTPMDRLICGDVGFGKTEIAVRAAFKAVNDNKQVAILVPTTILSMQHFRSFKERLKDFRAILITLIDSKQGKKQLKL